MVSAQSVNYDVLQIIFSHLSLHDLASVSQSSEEVSKMTPFAVIKAHPGLAAHVQNIDIRVIPNTRTKQRILPDPRFLHECISALQVSEFLASFTCTIGNALPPLLPFIQLKRRLHTIRIEARLTEEQTKLVCQLRGLHSVTLENASSAVMDALPGWAESLKSTLEHLTIHTSSFLNRTVLQRTIKHLPKLRGLHVIGCLGVSHVDVLSATEHTPFLESLALTIVEPDFGCDLPQTSLTELKHFAVEFITCRSVSPDAGIRTVPCSLIVSLLSLTRFTHLASLALRLSDRQSFPAPLVEKIVEMHGVHLRSVRFMGFTLDSEGIESLMGCEGLEKLAVSVPVEDIYTFAFALSGTATLHTLIDVVEHGAHGRQVSLTPDRVRVLLEEVPSLARVVSENRLWTSRSTPYGPETRLERMKSSRGTGFWFLPPPEVRSI